MIDTEFIKMSVRNKNFKLKFRGARRVFYLEDKAFEVEPRRKNYKEFWRRVFGGNRLPVCPVCKIDLILTTIDIARPCSVTSGYGTRVQLPSELQIDLKFQCSKCGTKVEGIGEKITFDSSPNMKWFSLEELRLTHYDLRAPP